MMWSPPGSSIRFPPAGTEKLSTNDMPMTPSPCFVVIIGLISPATGQDPPVTRTGCPLLFTSVMNAAVAFEDGGTARIHASSI